MKLTRVETLASEPELWMDEHKRAHWIDGSRVTDHDLQALPGSEALLAAVVRNGLTVLAAGDGGIEREELPCADPCEYDGCDRHHGQLAPSEQTRVGQHCSVCNRRFSVLSGSVMGCAVHGIQDTMEHREARKRILLGDLTDTARDQSLRVGESLPRETAITGAELAFRMLYAKLDQQGRARLFAFVNAHYGKGQEVK